MSHKTYERIDNLEAEAEADIKHIETLKAALGQIATAQQTQDEAINDLQRRVQQLEGERELRKSLKNNHP